MEMKICIVTVQIKDVSPNIRELFSEVITKFNKSNYEVKNYIVSTTQQEFIDIFWILNDVVPKNINPAFLDMILKNVKEKSDYDLIMFLNTTVLPLNDRAIDYAIDCAKEGQIVSLGLYDCLAMSKETYLRMGAPPAKELFNAARKQKIPLNNLIVSKVDSEGNKNFKNFKNEELFWQSSNIKNNFLKCEELLTENIYEDRSIKH